MASSTKNRRTAKTTPKAQPRTVKANDVSENRVIAKRLSHLSPADRKKAAAEFAKGTPIVDIAKKYGFKRLSNARYTVRQELVRQGKVSTLPVDAKALKAALKADDGYSDPAWVACRAGISGAKLRSLTK